MGDDHPLRKCQVAFRCLEVRTSCIHVYDLGLLKSATPIGPHSQSDGVSYAREYLYVSVSSVLIFGTNFHVPVYIYNLKPSYISPSNSFTP
jgi:hypothetical protein